MAVVENAMGFSRYDKPLYGIKETGLSELNQFYRSEIHNSKLEQYLRLRMLNKVHSELEDVVFQIKVKHVALGLSSPTPQVSTSNTPVTLSIIPSDEPATSVDLPCAPNKSFLAPSSAVRRRFIPPISFPHHITSVKTICTPLFSAVQSVIPVVTYSRTATTPTLTHITPAFTVPTTATTLHMSASAVCAPTIAFGKSPGPSGSPVAHAPTTHKLATNSGPKAVTNDQRANAIQSSTPFPMTCNLGIPNSTLASNQTVHDPFTRFASSSRDIGRHSALHSVHLERKDVQLVGQEAMLGSQEELPVEVCQYKTSELVIQGHEEVAEELVWRVKGAEAQEECPEIIEFRTKEEVTVGVYCEIPVAVQFRPLEDIGGRDNNEFPSRIHSVEVFTGHEEFPTDVEFVPNGGILRSSQRIKCEARLVVNPLARRRKRNWGWGCVGGLR